MKQLNRQSSTIATDKITALYCRLLLSSKIGPVLANNFPPQLLKNLFSVSEAPALIIKVQYLALMRQPVQQSCCEDSVAKKLRPAIKAFI